MLIATIAVGMGIDIPDVTVVVIWGLPQSMLLFWQEAGRCARDGRTGFCVCYAYPRSIAQPCDQCRKKRQRQCLCTSRCYTRELPNKEDCQRVYCVNFLASCEEETAELHSLKTKPTCDKNCEDGCSCEYCKCCINCMMKCSCSQRLKTFEDVLLFFR